MPIVSQPDETPVAAYCDECGHAPKRLALSLHDGRWLCAVCAPAAAIERESREFFHVAEDGSVKRVTGYICEGTPGYWWCPEIGVSACEGYSLFRDRVDAYDKAYGTAKQRLDRAKATLERIEVERWQ